MFRGLLAIVTLLMCSSVRGDLQCDVDLQYGIVVNERHIRIMQESRTVYQINGTDQLIVEGNWLPLEGQQQRDLERLAEGLHYVVPKMILLATEGVELAVDTVEHVYQGLVGQDHNSYEKLTASLRKVKGRIREKFIQSNDNFYMGPGSLENVDDLVDRELEEQLEQAISTSVGGVLTAIGGLNAGGDENTEQRIENLSRRIEIMEQEIERKVNPRANSLRQKARWFCNKMHLLDEIEDNLRNEVPALKKYNVILTRATAQPQGDQNP